MPASRGLGFGGVNQVDEEVGRGPEGEGWESSALHPTETERLHSIPGYVKLWRHWRQPQAPYRISGSVESGISVVQMEFGLGLIEVRWR